MKKLIVIGLALLLVVPSIDARRKKPKAGQIKDHVYQDSKYNFELTFRDNWKPKVGKVDDKARLALIKKNPSIPPDYINAPTYAQIPRLDVYIDTTSLGLHAFIDSLTNENYKSDQKKKIVRVFEFLQQPNIIPKGRDRLIVGEETGLFWKGEAKYMQEVQSSASSVGGKRVRSSYLGGIAALKRGDLIILFHVMAERDFFESPVKIEVLEMIKSFKWLETEG